MMKPVVEIRRTVKLIPTNFSPDWGYGQFDEPGKAEIKYPDAEKCILLFTCPGCGEFGQISVGFQKKLSSPSWLLAKGDRENVSDWTLTPSINCVGRCGWHGYLTDGVFRSV